MRFIKSFVVLVALFFASNVTAIFDAHIVNAATMQFPYHVAIRVWRLLDEKAISQEFATWDCSGAIVSTKYVITSYKCVTNFEFNGSFAGTLFEMKTECYSPSTETCTYYKTDLPPKTSQQAIALIEFDQIKFSEHVQPVMLPTHTSQSIDFSSGPDATYYATGYREEREGHLRYLSMQIVPSSDCSELLPENSIHTSSLLCVRGIDTNDATPKGSLCSEFGVPLVYSPNSTLIGIFDYADDADVSDVSDCTIGGPNLFINIASFVDWIEEQKTVK